MDPALLAADATGELLEVSGLRLVGANLLRGHNKVKVKRDVTAGFAEQLVVNVGDQPGLEGFGELLDRRVGFREWLPA